MEIVEAEKGQPLSSIKVGGGNGAELSGGGTAVPAGAARERV